MADRERYRALSEAESEIPLFMRPWWLDATCGPTGWDTALIEEKGALEAALPYALRRRAGFLVLTQPALTQFLGPWIRPVDGRPWTVIARQKELMTALIDQLPRFDLYRQNWWHGIGNWLPFRWRGFEQSTLYTYVLEDLTDLDALFAGLQDNLRREIRKATDRLGVIVDRQASLDDFLALNRMAFSRQGREVPYGDDHVRAIDAACAARSCRAILIARDGDGRPHAGVYMVWDAHSAYYLMGGADPALRSSGATSACLWDAISLAAGVTRRFDFEGSVMEGVERFVRNFGGRQVPYFRVTRTDALLLRGLDALRVLRGRRP